MVPISAASLQAVFSTLFRLCTYAYLRIIPAPLGRIVVPSLFLVYALLWVVDVLYPSKPALTLTGTKPLGAAGKDQKDEIKPSMNGNDLKLHVDTTGATKAAPTTSPTTINTILFSLPTSSTSAKLISFIINLSLLGMVADFTLRPLLNSQNDLVFTRVGAVYHDAAKIIVRYPGEESGVRIVWKQSNGGGSSGSNATLENDDDDESGWTDGPLVKLSPDQDWVGAAKLENLWTSTTYQYRLAASANSSLLPYPSSPITFKTFPDPRIPGTRFKFIASSCILPNFPYVPFTPSHRIKGFDLLHKQLSASRPAPEVADVIPDLVTSSKDEVPLTPQPSDVLNATHTDVPPASAVPLVASSLVENATPSISSAVTSPLEPSPVPSAPPVEPEFMLLLGDFIYADVPRPAKDRKEAFLTAYRQTYASADFRNVYERLPIFNIYDDHEFRNDFNGHSNESAPLWKNASTAWSAYQGVANYDSYHVDANGHKPYYFEFTHGDVAFFVFDTRRYRSVVGADTSDGDGRTILGDKQMADFTKWVGKVNSTAAFKFVISSVPLSGMWGGPNGQIDTWMGASRERRALKELLEYVPNVVLLSGDRHEFAAVEHIGAKPVYEFSVSPLSQFYIPFVPTFKQSNAPKRTVWKKENVTKEDGSVELQDVPVDWYYEEKILKYLPHGNYKWGTIEVDTTNADEPTVTFELSIDGQKAWEYKVVGQPVKWAGSTSLSPATIAGSVKEGVKNAISKLGRIFG